jgi:hypothetical protein
MDNRMNTSESIVTPKYSIVIISNENDAVFARKFITDIVGVGFNQMYTVFSINATTAFVYPNNIGRNVVREIYRDSNIMKLISKPMGALKSHLRNIACVNCKHISGYIDEKGSAREIPEMKRELMELDIIRDMETRVAKVALIVMKYKEMADVASVDKKKKKSYFNKKRDCYLVYLTAYNDILSRTGPLRFAELIWRVHVYSYLCRTNIHPAYALDGLIALGALSIDQNTTIVSIPDRM